MCVNCPKPEGVYIYGKKKTNLEHSWNLRWIKQNEKNVECW